MASISAIALACAPVVASNAIFSARRAGRGIDAIDEKPIYGAMNLNIAAGQTLKGCQAATKMAVASNSELAMTAHSATKTIKSISDGSKVLNGLGKVVDFTANNINPIICLTSGVKVLSSENKTDAAAREILCLSSMFAAEKLAKKAVGMPSFKNGKIKVSKAFFESQIKAIDDYCAVNKLFNKVSLKYVPGVLKGLFFVGASIGGYKLGSILSDALLGKECA